MKAARKKTLSSLAPAIAFAALLASAAFAWAGSADASKAAVETGSLDLEVSWSETCAEESWTKASVVTDDGEQRKAIAPLFSSEVWEPGHTEVRYVELSNEDGTPFSYKIEAVFDGEVGELADAIDVYYGEVDDVIASRGDLEGRLSAGSLSQLNGGLSALAGEGAIEGQSDGETTVAVILRMQENAGNEFQGKSVSDFSVKVTATAAEVTSEEATLAVEFGEGGASATAVLPAGVAVSDGEVQLKVAEVDAEDSQANVALGEGEVSSSYDVHIDGVSSGNQTPILVTLEGAASAGLNRGNVRPYHVEDGQTHEMERVDALDALKAHNQFFYDPATGMLTLCMATFSEVAVVSNEANPWQGEVDVSWYGAEADELRVANADQLAGLGAIVAGTAVDVDGNAMAQDSFAGKTVRLTNDVNLAGNGDATEHYFYPIGYTSDGYGGPFRGAFDGAGHTVRNLYQNGWAMEGGYDKGYFNDAMGLFGYVHAGTVRNLTLDSFVMVMEFAPMGCVTAYAAGECTFENIALANCHPQTYNTGVAGIVGWDVGGDSEDEASDYTFKNITIDNTNTITALWGSWDVAAGGLMGYLGEYGTVSMENCHVAAVMDVYNDVCANYQYYWYRYCGMLIGTVDRTQEDENGTTVLDLGGIEATNCTVDFGDWNDYWYCELVANTKASYTHDYQFSRLTEVSSEEEMSTQGTNHYVIVDRAGDERMATCYHYINGEPHEHAASGEEIIDGATVLVEDKTCVNLPFNQVFGGYGWGVKGTDIDDLAGIEVLGITEAANTTSVEKFETVFENTDKYLYRVGNGNAVSLGSLFRALDDAEVNGESVYVTIDAMDEGTNVSGKFTANADDWTQGTVEFTGTGPVKLTIQDYQYCKETELCLEVVDACNVASYGELQGRNSVLLSDITMSSGGTFRLSNATLYGNGFTFDVTDGAYAGVDYDYQSYVISLEDSKLDNVEIVGAVYPKIGSTRADSYNRAIVLASGNSVIENSFISNGASPVRSGGNLEIVNSTLKGGAYANLDFRSGRLILDNVTTINQVGANDVYGDDTVIVGLGVVVYQEGGTEDISIIVRNALTQYNYLSKAQADTYITDTMSKQVTSTMFGSDFSGFQYEDEVTTWVNTGIISMNNNFTAASLVDERDDRQGYTGQSQTVSTMGVSRDCYVYTVKPEVIEGPSGYAATGQGAIAPSATFDYAEKNYVAKTDGSNDYCYEDGGVVRISMDEGDAFSWDTAILDVSKNGRSLEYAVEMDGIDYTGQSIVFDTAGNYTVEYSYVDEDNYQVDENGNTVKYSKSYIQTVYISVAVVKADAKHAEFSFGAGGTAYSGKTVQVGDSTYVMPDVTATVDGKIGSTSVDGTTIYYPITEMFTSDGKTAHTGSWYACFPIFEDALQIIDYEDGGTGDAAKYNQTTVTTVDGIPSTLVATNPTSAFLYSMNATNYPPPTDPTAVDSVVCYTCNRSGLTSSNTRSEMTVVAEYKYTDNAGATYYYYVGYHCAEQTSGGSCVAPGTLITLANGSQVPVEELTGSEELLAWNLETGSYDSAPIVFVDSDERAECEVIRLTFSDGTEVEVISEHGFFDIDLGEYVYLDRDAAQYIGHSFIKQGDLAADAWDAVELVDVVLESRQTEAYSPVTASHLCYYVNGMLSMPGGIDGLFNIFEVDAGSMAYDQQAKEADIAEYGLFTYDDFEGVVSEEFFEAFNGSYLKVAMGKGLITWDGIEALAGRYNGFDGSSSDGSGVSAVSSAIAKASAGVAEQAASTAALLL